MTAFERRSEEMGRFGGIWSEVSTPVAPEAADLTTGLPLDKNYKKYIL